MTADDFRSNEKSAVVAADGSLRIELVGDDGETTVLKESVPVARRARSSTPPSCASPPCASS